MHCGVRKLVRSPHQKAPEDAAMHVAVLRLARERVAEASAVHQHRAPVCQACRHMSTCLVYSLTSITRALLNVLGNRREVYDGTVGQFGKLLSNFCVTFSTYIVVVMNNIP